MVIKSGQLKHSLFFVFLISALYVLLLLQLGETVSTKPLIVQFLSLVYMWSPGIIGIIFARRELLKLPIFAKPDKVFYLIPVITFMICLVTFLLCIPFGLLDTSHPMLQNASLGIGSLIVMAVLSYIFMILLGSFLFLGEEIYWRGYLLEKLKKYGPLKAILGIALLWSIWQLPTLLIQYEAVTPAWQRNGYGIILNFLLTPILIYFRLKGRSIFSSALFHSSLMAAFLFFFMLFPIKNLDDINILGLYAIGLLLLFSFYLKLFSSSTWKKLL